MAHPQAISTIILALLLWIYIVTIAFWGYSNSGGLPRAGKYLLLWSLPLTPVSVVFGIASAFLIGGIALTMIASAILATIVALIVGATIKIAYLQSSPPNSP